MENSMALRLLLRAMLVMSIGCLGTVGCFEAGSEEPIVLKAAPGSHSGFSTNSVTVQHILINFGTVTPGFSSERSKQEAKDLAIKLKELAENGEEFQALVDEYSVARDQQSVFQVIDSNLDSAMLSPSVVTRQEMVKSFGDVAFGLELGEVGIAEYDPTDCPYGYHVIKRIK